MFDLSEIYQAHGTPGRLAQEDSDNQRCPASIGNRRRVERLTAALGRRSKPKARAPDLGNNDHHDIIVGIRNGLLCGALLWPLLFSAVAIAL